MRHLLRSTAVLLLLAAAPVLAQEAPKTQAAPKAQAAPFALRDGDRVAIIGDSITEQKQYSVFVEAYLLAAKPAANLSAVNVGWSGETTWRFVPRMQVALAPFKATVATTCYGMNDGGYGPMTDEKAEKYKTSLDQIVAYLQSQNVRVLAGSPGPVDTYTYVTSKNRPKDAAEVYNKTLSALGDVARQVAADRGATYLPMNETLNPAMVALKAKFGPEYDVFGGDGIHPANNGHLLMAYAVLKALNVPGEIGTFTLDAAAGTAAASAGHSVVAATRSSLEVESTKYPFCTYIWNNSPKASMTTRAVPDVIPFHQDLNRLTLKVSGLAPGNYALTWSGSGGGGGSGAADEKSKTFSAEQLAAGVNLAAEFPDNPFSDPFNRVLTAVKLKQEYDVFLIKQVLQARLGVAAFTPGQLAAYEETVRSALAMQTQLTQFANASVTPVRHKLRIEPLK